MLEALLLDVESYYWALRFSLDLTQSPDKPLHFHKALSYIVGSQPSVNFPPFSEKQVVQFIQNEPFFALHIHNSFEEKLTIHQSRNAKYFLQGFKNWCIVIAIFAKTLIPEFFTQEITKNAEIIVFVYAPN